MSERRYNEAEVAAIFERATETRQTGERRQPLSSDGMTLAELQEIGRDVGIAPDQIAEAARLVTQNPAPAPRVFLGLPIGVARTVDLDRTMTEPEWERLVAELRETFDARGNVRSEGSLRSWTNSRLQVLLEPTDHGQRVRLRTFKGGAREQILIGISMIAGAAIGLGAAPDGRRLVTLGILGVLGAVMSAGTALRLPGWARRRQQQFEEIAARVASQTALPSGRRAK